MHVVRRHYRAGILEAEMAIVDSVMGRAFGGGEATGQGLADSGIHGRQHTLAGYEHGVPIDIHTTPANTRDRGQTLPVGADLARVPVTRVKPLSHPDTLFADLGCDSEAIRDALHAQAIESFTARRREDHGSSLGRRRWGVEPTIPLASTIRHIRG